MANEENTEIKLQNWFLCALCQKQTGEKLINPQKCTRKNVGSGYCTLAVNLLKFQYLGAVPIGAPLANLDGSGIESTLRKMRHVGIRVVLIVVVR